MYKKFVFAFVLFTTLALVSCKKENPMENDENQSSMMMNMEDGEARLDKHIEMVDLDTPFGFGNLDSKKDKMKGKFHEKAEKMKGMMKKKLDLTDEQVELMKSAKDEMKACSETARTGIKSILASEFESANAKRDVIITSMNNNEITKDEAKDLLQSLKAEVKESIKSNTEIIAFKEELKVCYTDMKTKIESILTAEQLEKMKEMKSKHEKRHRKGKK